MMQEEARRPRAQCSSPENRVYTANTSRMPPSLALCITHRRAAALRCYDSRNQSTVGQSSAENTKQSSFRLRVHPAKPV